MTAPALDRVDAALTTWRERLAAASRNVSELSELPAYLAAKQLASGAGRLAAEARTLAATMDELWQGVLLIGATLDRAEQVRRTGSRLWRAEETAAEVMAILDRSSISVDLADTPVLHRSLLAGARATAVVSPDTLLHTMQDAFDSARDRLTRIGEASAQAESLQRALQAEAAGLPAWAPRLHAIEQDVADPLDRLDALNGLRPALAASAAVQAGIEAARQDLGTLAALAARAQVASARCRAATTAVLPAMNEAGGELEAWLDRIGQTVAADRTQAAGIGLANWRALHDRAFQEARVLESAATAALARCDELRARLGLLRAKRQAHNHADLDSLEDTAQRALMTPVDLDAAASALRAYQAALSRL